MTERLKLVAVSGGLQRPSRTLVLVEEIAEALGATIALDLQVIELGELTPALGGALYRSQLCADAQAQLEAIERADALVVASPVYRGSFSGLFKHLFDLIGQDALVGKPVLLAATGGSDRHALVIEHQLRPLFAFFQALTLPLGVYAAERDFSGYELASAALRERIALAVGQALPWLRALGATPARVEAVAA